MLILPKPVLDLLDRQFGSAARRQLVSHMPERQIDWAVETERLRIEHWGVYTVAGGGRPVEQRAMAAVLRARAGRISGPYLLGLHGAEGFNAVEDPFVVLLKPGRRLMNVDFLFADDLALGRHEAYWGALPAGTPTLAAIDSAHPRFEIPDKRLRVGIDSLRWSGKVTTARLQSAIRELPAHPGAIRLDAMFRSGMLINESEAEREVDVLARRISPAPQRQVAVIPGRRVDFLWQPLWYILEYDGDVHLSPETRQRDEDRDDDFEAAGYHVDHITKHDLVDPDRFLAWLAATLQRRARQLGVPVQVRVR